MSIGNPESVLVKVRLGRVTALVYRAMPFHKLVIKWESNDNQEAEAVIELPLTGSLLLARLIPGRGPRAPAADYDITLLDESFEKEHDITGEELRNPGVSSAITQHDIPLVLRDTGDNVKTERFIPVAVPRFLFKVGGASTPPAAGELQLFWDPQGRL